MSRLVVMPCACGSPIAANPDDAMQDVQRHQATKAHSSWADREYPSLDPTAGITRFDLSLRVPVRPARRAVLVGLGYEL